MDSATEKVSPEQKPWSDLPTDITHSIVSYVPFADYPLFASVCKEWNQTAPLVYPAYKCPLLMHYMKKDRGKCRYYNPYFNKIFIVDAPLDFLGSDLLYSKDGWIAFFRRNEFVFVHPLTWTTHSFQVDDKLHGGYVAFSCDPSSSDCIIFFIASVWKNSVDIGIIQGENWSNRTTLSFNNALPFVMSSHSNPVFVHGQFYCLGVEGNLGVFDPSVSTWTVLAKPKKPDVCFERNFLMESKGDLLSVFVGKHDSSVHIFRLDQQNMVWEKYESLLGDDALFVGWPMSMSATTSRRMRNKLYFPRLQGDPELIEADVKISQSQVFFVSKLRDRKQDLKKAKGCGGITYYDLESRELFNHYKSEEFMHGIWFEPTA